MQEFGSLTLRTQRHPMAPYFGSIILQAKDEASAWRAFVVCRDEQGGQWELRGYGGTPAEAAEQAWARFQDRNAWAKFGRAIPPPVESPVPG